jgi:transposase
MLTVASLKAFERCDLNPIETLWAIIKKKLLKMDCSTKEKMISAVNDIWSNDKDIQESCARLIRSMPKRVEAVLKAKGGHTSY